MAVHHPGSRCHERSRCPRLVVGIDRRVGMHGQIPEGLSQPAGTAECGVSRRSGRGTSPVDRSVAAVAPPGCPVEFAAKVRQRPGRQPYAGPCLRCWSWGVRGRWVTAGGNAKLAATDPTLTGCGTRQ